MANTPKTRSITPEPMPEGFAPSRSAPTGSQTINPLLNRVKMPGETFTLPSGGLFYKEGEVLAPDVKKAEVYVQPMTAIDEIVMKTPDMLFSGRGAEEVFGRCIPQVLNVRKMLSKDVDFLLACLRKVSYGDEMQVEYTHDCKDAKQHTYVLDLNKFISQAKRIDPTTLEKNFTAEMPNGQVVRIQPVTFQAFIDMMEILNSVEDETPEVVKSNMIKSLANIIVDVDGIEDKAMIEEWLDMIPAGYLRKINTVAEKNTGWGTDFTAKVKCKDCGKMIEVSAAVNPLSFFT